ncbi:hypothetical protein [Nannocystis pusilla]|uniref:hypothetical protein n=1 Tax=Nannocystis pusilla TaxID=889268 RepID=UPI003B7A91E0
MGAAMMQEMRACCACCSSAPATRPAASALVGPLGWEPFADAVEACEIPGDHFSIMKGDNVAQLAAAIHFFRMNKNIRP